MFDGNSAQFGPDIASYAVRIKQVVSNSNGSSLADIVELDDVPSGLVIDSSIELAVVSAEQDQIMVSDSKSIIKIVALDASSKVSGQNTDTLTQGRANFTNTLFTAAPGRRGVKFRLVSSAIDYTVIQHLDPVKYADQIVTVNFRWCKPGEIQIGNICSACSAGSYSVTWNATQCKP